MFINQRPRGTIFTADDPRWKCCCNSCHVRKGALMIGYVQLGLILLGGLCLTALLVTGGGGAAAHGDGRTMYEGGDTYRHLPPSTLGGGQSGARGGSVNFYQTALAAYGGAMVIQLVIVVSLLYGAHREKRMWLVPHMITSVLGICISGLRLMACFSRSYSYSHSQRQMLSYQAMVILLGMSIHTCFFMVVYRLYQYIGEKAQPLYYIAGEANCAHTMAPRYDADGAETESSGGVGSPPTYYAAVTNPACPPPAYSGGPDEDKQPIA